MPHDYSAVQEAIEDRAIENYDRDKRLIHRPDLELRLDDPEATEDPAEAEQDDPRDEPVDDEQDAEESDDAA